MRGILNLSTVFDGKNTVTDDIYFTPPFKLYSPFYENQWAKYISMCGSAGVLAGDKNEVKLFIGESCKVFFTDQGYQKLFNTNGKFSQQSLNIVVSKNAELCYMPHPIMTFSGCDHRASGKVNITESSVLIFSEIYCCGRTAMGEEFGLKNFRSRTEITIDGTADFIDNTLISPSLLPIRDKGFFEGFTHTGFMYIYTPDKTILDFLYEDSYIENKIQLCCSRTEKGIALRALGFSGEEIYEKFLDIAQKVRNKNTDI